MKRVVIVVSLLAVLAGAFTVGRFVGSVELLKRAEKAEKEAEVCARMLVH